MITKLNRWVYLICTILLVAFIWTTYKGCQQSRTRLADATRLQAQTDSLQMALTVSETRIATLRTNYTREMSIVSQQEAVAAQRTDSMGKVLSATQTRVKRLLNERTQVWDGPMVGVPADCDTCFELLKTLDLQVTTTTENFNELNRILNYEVAIRDSALEVERRHSDTLQLRAGLLTKLATQAVSLVKPRNKIYFTTTLITDLTGVGYGGGFTLVTKKDKVWGAKVGVWNKQLFYTADFGMKLSLRKK